MPPLPTAFRRNALANYANSLVALVLALVVTPLLVRGLGKEAYGTWVPVSTSVVYLNLLQFGFGQATTKYVAEGLAVDDRSKVRRAVSTSVAALSIPGALVLAAAPGSRYWSRSSSTFLPTCAMLRSSSRCSRSSILQWRFLRTHSAPPSPGPSATSSSTSRSSPRRCRRRSPGRSFSRSAAAWSHSGSRRCRSASPLRWRATS